MASVKGAGRILRICLNAVQPRYVKLLSEWRGGVRSLLERYAAKELIGGGWSVAVAPWKCNPPVDELKIN